MSLHLSTLSIYENSLDELPLHKILISTLNAHSFNQAQKDKFFAEALINSNVLLPDGISIILAELLLNRKRLKKIAGIDLFYYEMNRINLARGTCLFLGSTENTLKLISERASVEFPEIAIFTYSPPFKSEFSVEDDNKMIEMINLCKPDVLFIGMTAPKQEKWAYKHIRSLDAGHVCCIGAVFDFYSGNINRAPKIMINIGLEWLYRLIKEPVRMWKRYLIGNVKFVYLIIKEKILIKKS
jgi:N-acetylglucosaminyldiphosphoundecaprenol N-acetyl-beta-D-mannosaminyltransferase